MTSQQQGFAIVGASERGIPWTEWLLENLRRHGYGGERWLVNPRRESLHGLPCLPDIDALPSAPEAAALLTNPDQVLAQAERLIDRGCRRLMVVSNGFAELGTAEGRAREGRLQELCADRDVLLVGPNCVGFAFFHEHLVAISEPVVHDLEPGDVSLVSQSGGLTAAALQAIHNEGLGADFVASLGNGAVLDVARALEFAVERDTTRVVLGIVESLARTETVERAAATARREGKTIALLLLGASAGGRGVAASHTGAVVSEQRNVGSWLRSLGIVTASSVEELARVATLADALDGDASGGVVATLSGGGAGLTADLAARDGVPLAALGAATVDRLREALPAGAYIGNPLDINTGDAAAVYAALADDPGVRFLIEPWQLPWPTADGEYHWQRDGIDRLLAMSTATGLPVLIASVANQPVSAWMHERTAGTALTVSSGLDLTLAALSGLARGPRSTGDLPATQPSGGGTGQGRIVAEARARDLLAAAGLPIVAGAEVADGEAAVALAADLTRPLAVKLSLDTVAHKGRVGGVCLGVTGPAAVRDACAQIRQNAVSAGVSDGSDVRFLVTEMVTGPELLVGVVRDPVAGACLTVGIGGWAAEAGAIFGTVPVSLSGAELRQRVQEWNLPHLVGAERADALAAFLEQLGTAVTAGPLADYREVELNPVMLTAAGAVIVDALLIAADED